MDHFLSGLFFGLVAGASPGPLSVLVITETLKNNRRAGFLVAIAPAITDIPIIIFTVVVLSYMQNTEFLLAIISFAGAIFLIYLGIQTIKIKGFSIEGKERSNAALKKGMITNILSPPPYMFWLLVGTPLLFKAYQSALMQAVYFLIGFYLLLISSKMLLAIISEKSRKFMQSRVYVSVMRILGLVLLFFAAILLKDGLAYLKT
jgi:threonine/homoserine/homoserine lactone efflux protein